MSVSHCVLISVSVSDFVLIYVYVSLCGISLCLYISVSLSPYVCIFMCLYLPVSIPSLFCISLCPYLPYQCSHSCISYLAVSAGVNCLHCSVISVAPHHKSSHSQHRAGQSRCRCTAAADCSLYKLQTASCNQKCILNRDKLHADCYQNCRVIAQKYEL